MNQTKKSCLENGEQIWQSYFFSSYTSEVKEAVHTKRIKLLHEFNLQKSLQERVWVCIDCWTQGLYLSTAGISADKLILHFLLLLSLKSHNRSVQSLGIKTSDKQVLVSVLNFSLIDQIHFSTSLIRCLSKEESNIHSKPQVIKIDLEVGNLQMFPFTEGDVRCCLVYFCLFQKLVPSDKELLCLLPLYRCQCHIICRDRYLYHCGLSSASSESTNYHLLHCSTFCVLWDEYDGRGGETGMTSWVKQG